MDKGLLVFLLIVCGGIPAYIIFLLIKVSKLKNQNDDIEISFGGGFEKKVKKESQ